MKNKKTHEWTITADGITKEWVLMKWQDEIKINFKNIPENKTKIIVKVVE